MLDMSWGEVLVIGAVALIVIGPKDLPRTLRMVGQAVGKVKRMAGEFQGQFNEAMREADMESVRKEFEGINRAASSVGTPFNPLQTIRDEVKGAIEKQPTATAAAGVAIASAYEEAKASEPAPGAEAPVHDLPPPDLPPIGEPVIELPPAHLASSEPAPLKDETKS